MCAIDSPGVRRWGTKGKDSDYADRYIREKYYTATITLQEDLKVC